MSVHLFLNHLNIYITSVYLNQTGHINDRQKKICSSPRKAKNSKSPTGEYVVPHKQTRRVNPNRGKQGVIPEKESPGIANSKGDPSWRQRELILRCQGGNSNEDPSWCQKELVPSCQQEIFAPTQFENQISVLNFGHGVQYSNIWINGFPFARLTFLLSQRSGKKTDVCYDSLF